MHAIFVMPKGTDISQKTILCKEIIYLMLQNCERMMKAQKREESCSIST